MGEIDYEDWYPEVLPVMDTRDLAELLHTNEQIIRACVREGTIPAHRRAFGRGQVLAFRFPEAGGLDG